MTPVAALAVASGLVATVGLVVATNETRVAKSHPSVHGPDTVNVSDFREPGTDDAAAIDAAIAAADSGDTVYFPSGDYDLDRPVRLASGLNYVGDESGATLRSDDPDGLELAHTGAHALHDVTVRGLAFDNVRITIGGTATEPASDITFHRCRFEGGHESSEWSEPYVRLTHTEGVTIDECEFLRGQGHGGRGVIARKTRLTVIKDSYFGTTRELEPSVPHGHFRTAINVSGYDVERGEGSSEVVVDGNVWRRTPGIGEPPGCGKCQDHGLYAWGTDRLFIVGNRADGWDTSAAGGALKLRNQSNTFVLDNTLSTSGILTYVYASDSMPQHLSQVVIRGNTIDLGEHADCRGAYCGISYWRNFDGNGRYEHEVHIAENTFTRGGSIRISRGYGPEFCVQGNQRAKLAGRSKGVRRSGCAEPRAWARPLAGIHRGDFNGDGAQDFVHHVQDDDGRGYWRARLSSGAGFETARWDSDLYTSGRTAEYGVHVGDFDGDGRDDLTYSGRCGDRRPCWRTHLTTEHGFGPADDWGHDLYASEETRTHGFEVGDFDGDGRDDLLARGYCADREPCWRVQASTGSSFTPRNAGGDTNLGVHGALTKFLIGDYNGDSRDDVAYVGRCGSGEACLRVRINDGGRFAPGGWGDHTHVAGDFTSHIEMLVADVDGDGLDDIGYAGRCGDEDGHRWRFHVSNGSGFDVRCSLRRREAFDQAMQEHLPHALFQRNAQHGLDQSSLVEREHDAVS